jgi:hypothetical protein
LQAVHLFQAGAVSAMGQHHLVVVDIDDQPARLVAHEAGKRGRDQCRKLASPPARKRQQAATRILAQIGQCHLTRRQPCSAQISLHKFGRQDKRCLCAHNPVRAIIVNSVLEYINSLHERRKAHRR